MPAAGEDYNGYVILKALGRGGSATVYLAHRPGSGTAPVALKVLHADRRGVHDIARLEREFGLAQHHRHEHIIDVCELGPYWLSMQYVDGGNAAVLAAGPATVPDRLRILAQIAGALDFVHHDGIVHCDVKPANILLFKEFSRASHIDEPAQSAPARSESATGAEIPAAVLIDFGVAHSLAEDMTLRLSRDPAQRFSLDPAKRITHHSWHQPEQMQASLPYAAPEILLGRMPSAATDQYSLACTAVELLTGETPFSASTPAGLIDAHVEQPPPRVSGRTAWIPSGVDNIVAKAMAKDPDRRYGSCSAFIDLMARALRRKRT